MAFSFHSCTTCSLRFPAPAADGGGSGPRSCPRCRRTTVVDPPAPTPAARAPGASPTCRAAVLLDNVRSLANVGAIFRSADAAGVAPVYLAGITPTPAHPRLKKTALGAEATVPWCYHADARRAAERARTDGFRLWILEGDGEDLLSAPHPAAPVCLVVGHERAGVDPRLRPLADRVVRLPMLGVKGSLNVAAAATTAFYLVRYGARRPTPPAEP